MLWLWDIFFPPFCGGCGWIGTYLCKKCKSELAFIPPHYVEWWYVKNKSMLCKVTARSVVSYEPPATSLIHNLKYTPAIDLVHPIAKLLFHCAPTPKRKKTVVTSVPAHPFKKRERRFDQSQLIAQQLSTWWNIPYIELLTRKMSQLSLADQKSKQDRKIAAESVFTLQENKIGACMYDYDEIILIDDVMTTGSTVRVCAELLAQLGAPNISILTFARKL